MTDQSQSQSPAIEQDTLAQFTAEAAAVDTAAKVAPEPEGAQAAPEGAQAAPEAVEQPTIPLLTTKEEAGKLVDLVAWGMSKMFPVLEYTDATKTEAAAKLAPLLQKYNLSSELLNKWGAEFEAGLFFGGLAVASYHAIKQAKQPVEVPPKKSWWNKFFAKATA